MTSIILRSKVGPDGILHLEVPVGATNANQEVIVTVKKATETVEERRAWHEFLESIEGKWQGDFERPPQGELEVREPFE